MCAIAITLLAITTDTLEAELQGDLAALAARLGVAVDEWPPIGGEWDLEAMRFFRGLLEDRAADARFGPCYVVIDSALVGHAGFFGPPDERGEVEIGYSVCESHRRRGIATAVIAGLCERAADLGCSTVRAHVRADNVASIRSLVRNGFVAVDDAAPHDGAEDEQLLFRRSLSVG